LKYLNLSLIALTIFLSGCDPKDLPSHTVQICNENSVNIRYTFSVAYFDKITDDWVSKGWWHIDPGKCVTSIDARHSGKLYIHGRYGLFKSGNSSDGSFWGDVGDFLGDLAVIGSVTSISGNYMFCVHPNDAFNVISDTRCASRGYQNQGFHEIDIKSYKDTLVEFYDEGKYKTSYK